MKKINLILALCLASLLTSCGSNNMLVIPKAVNTVNAVSLDELNLTRADYQIINTVSADATIVYSEAYNGSLRKIECPEEDFELIYRLNPKTGWQCEYVGIVKLGYLANDHRLPSDMIMNPEEVVRRLAIYRLINLAKLEGADGVIEPIVSTNIDNGDSDKKSKKIKDVVFKTTVSAKLIKLKSNN